MTLTMKRFIMIGIRCTLLACFLLLVPLTFLNLFNLLDRGEGKPTSFVAVRPAISCIQAIGNQEVQDLGHLVQRNQLAFYVANLFQTKISFPLRNWRAGDHSRYFSPCMEPMDGCILRHKDIGLLHCQEGDCACAAMAVAKHIVPLSQCSVLGVENIYQRSTDYSGCIHDVLLRYFGHARRWPRLYDAVYYVNEFQVTDKRAAADGAVFTDARFTHLMHALCVLSDRDIVVVTEIEPEIPLCGNRTVLARTDTLGALNIVQHASHLAVGGSSLGMTMMELTNPLRMVLLSESSKKFVWMKMPLLTLVRGDGHLFNFLPGEINAAMDRGLDYATPEPGPTRVLLEPQVPKRRWEDEALSSKLFEQK